ncbi:MAG: conjugal transfer protein TraX [archaeon]|nr:conjugal transfer protein TraX [archaeon]
MFFDHLSYFIPPTNVLPNLIGFISRLTAPTMALFIAEGYHYTSNINKYMKRLFIFAVISYIPYCLYRTAQLFPIQLFSGNTTPLFFRATGAIVNEPYVSLSYINSTLVIHETSVIFTLFLGLIAIYLWDRVNISKIAKVIITGFMIWISAFANWQFYLIFMCLIFYFLKDNPKKMWIAYSIVGILYIYGYTIC